MTEGVRRPYPPIAAHGVIGDRRTAALVARDGTIDWCCLPDFNGDSVFGALLDAARGGSWRLGPASGAQGHQDYLDASAVLRTVWKEPGGELELTDCMPWPERATGGGNESRRVILRRLRCTAGTVTCIHQFDPRLAFGAPAPVVTRSATPPAEAPQWLGLWSSDSGIIGADATGEPARFELAAGETLWLLAAFQESGESWSTAAAARALDETLAAWSDWAKRHPYLGPQRDASLASLRTMRLLSYEPSGSQVAAPTTSLPERIGGDRNYDYRYAWVRDSSLALAIMAVFGDLQAAGRYMDWLAGLSTTGTMPLQVLYGIDGSCDVSQRELPDLDGYRTSRPVRIGNHAAQQLQLDSLGYLADCALIFLQQGGQWKPPYTRMMEDIVAFTQANWQVEDNGIWELGERHHYVSSKAMGWVVFDRVGRIFRKLGRDPDPHWERTAQAILREVAERGWSERRQGFRQHYDTDELDASTLLLGLMGFLAADHPRNVANVAAIQRELQRDGFVWRFHPRALGQPDQSLDGLEGAFVPCTFWLASALAKLERTDEARAVLERAEAAFGPLGLYAEEFDPVRGEALGNFPLLFSHAEHLRAVMDLAKAQPLQMAEMMAGKVAGKVLRALRPG